jgi:hypothetical protein
MKKDDDKGQETTQKMVRVAAGASMTRSVVAMFDSPTIKGLAKSVVKWFHDLF